MNGKYYWTENKHDGLVIVWYPDGDQMAEIYDDLGADIYARDIARQICARLNRESIAKMRKIIERLAPVIRRKVDAGACIHDIFSDQQWQAIYAQMLEVLTNATATVSD